MILLWFLFSAVSAQTCPENQQYIYCGTSCQATCDNLTVTETIHTVCLDNCTDGCFCKQGFVLHTNGSCVEPKDCPNPPECQKPNEVFSACDYDCATCAVPKPKTCHEHCKAGCFCKLGFLRDEHGDCVEARKCLLTSKRDVLPPCKSNERFLPCGSACEPSCQQPNPDSIQCGVQCIEGCFCKEGFLKNEKGECVEPQRCPPMNSTLQCKLNEEFSPCGTHECEPTCENPEPDTCSSACKPGCSCKKGFLRDDKGNCVEPTKCQRAANQCKLNEEFSPCGGHGCEPTCDVPEPTSCSSVCKPGCPCKKGFVRDGQGNCVEPRMCPKDTNKCLKPHEEFSPCDSACQGTCAKGVPSSCSGVCAPGCVCKNGYLRDDQGNCVEASTCVPKNPSSKCKPTEVFSNCSVWACEPSCDIPAPIACPLICQSGCFCQKGLLRDKCGDCVEPSKCPKDQQQCSKPNEEFSQCGPVGCEPSCDQKAQIPIACPAICGQGCFCKQGFYRDSDGSCVEPHKCQKYNQSKCSKPNEEYSECGTLACEPSCENPQPSICPAICNSGCFCKKGFLREKDGSCVEPQKCLKNIPKCNYENEEFNPCGSSFCEPSCRMPSPLFCPFVCKPGCFCEKGYLRHEFGHCVQAQDCNKNVSVKCTGPNEIFNLCGVCEPTCKEPNMKPTACLRFPGCLRGCFCAPGYLRNDDGNCVEQKDCPRYPQCSKPNQKWNECGTACEPTCNNPNPLECTKQCVPGCFCEPGYLKDDNGNCIEQKNCPKAPQQCNKPNQKWNDCGTACEPTCKNPNPQTCPKICVRGCFCDPGYLKDDNGNCVEQKNCPEPPQQCNKPNQKWNDCGTACEPTCNNPNPLECSKQCVRGCFCEPGYLKDDNGNCVEQKNCLKPLQQCNKPNQKWSECGSACEPTCNNPNPRLCILICVRGCFCEPGYLKDDNGNCVEQKNCPKSPQCNKPNQKWNECGTACEPTCKNPNPQTCPRICVSGCFCDPGYVKDDNGNCVEQKNCPKLPQQCNKPNQKWNECGTACEPTCKNPNPQICPKICVSGCFCDPGYLKDDNGNCVEQKNCPKPPQQCNKPNQKWNECGTACEPTCKNPNPQTCPKICVRGCFCDPGYLKDDNGNCVEHKSCPASPQQCNRPNQKWNECGTACESTCNNPNPLECSKQCVRGCFCYPGFVKNEQGDCVRPDECPDMSLNSLVSCPEAHEKFSTCGSPCQPNCMWPKPDCIFAYLGCIQGCFCEPGYVRNIEGKCLLLKDCPVYHHIRREGISN